ncbi:MAG: EamA family transporter [candidate division NC10 bacterium]|nr:EamA family transporter [candidate division NC10 bacterium]
MVANAYFLLLVAIVIGVIGQLLLKYGMSRRPDFRLRDFAELARDLHIIGGFCCYAIATVFYLQVLARLDLSVAYPSVSLGYVFVVIMSRVLFEEPVTVVRWMAVAIICIGVALVGIGSG